MAKNKVKFPQQLAKYLAKARAKYKVMQHKTVYTAYDVAATMKKKLGEVAKTLLVAADKNYYLVILPADHNLDFKKLAKIIGQQSKTKVKVIKIPNEKVMAKVLKIKAGTMSAFGGIHKLPVIMDKSLTKVKKAVFSTGSFNHSLEMAVKDFIKQERATIGLFGVKKTINFRKK